MTTERDAASEALPQNDVSAKGIVLGGIGLFIGILLSSAIVAGLFLWLSARDHRSPPSPLEVQRIIPPEPRLEVDPVASRADVERVAREKISGYAWVDRSRGLARIPVEAAMAALSTRGWPDPENRP